jgi:hypothetical protein
LLLEWGEDFELNGTDEYENCPLFGAMYNHMRWREDELEGAPGRWLRTIRVLLAHGAKPNVKDGYHWETQHRGIPKELLKDLREFSEKENVNYKTVL